MTYTIPASIDKQKLEELLTKLSEETINKPEAIELKQMLQDIVRTSETRIGWMASNILMGLSLFIYQPKNDEDTYRVVRERL
jgi:hypothetical protein